MPKLREAFSVPSLKAVDRASPVGRSVAQALRDAIVSGELKPGERLPSTRSLAASLGVARGTLTEVFSQLKAEGYLETKVGAGTRVAASLTAALSEVTGTIEPAGGISPVIDLPPSAARLTAVAQALEPHAPVPFAIAVPAEGVAPDDAWRRLGNRIRASRNAAPQGYGDPRGEMDLREAIADHVRRARAVRCEADQVIITSGTQQGLYMAGRVLLAREDAVWAEDPAYPGLTAVLDDLDVQTHRVPVDEQGMVVERGIEACPGARAAFVTPSHQYPLCMPLSMGRRASLIAWAEASTSWIVEDDYDSELRYAGHPFPAMQGLCPSRVVYLGTFSKVLFPSLRLGYIVAPAPLVGAFAGMRAILDRHSPTAEQHVLAAYMREGMFESHVRRIRGLYAERRASLLSALAQNLPGDCEIQPSDQGMHIVLWLRDKDDDVAVAARARRAGIMVRPISPMYGEQGGRPGLMLGFGGFTQQQIEQGVRSLTALIGVQAAAR